MGRVKDLHEIKTLIRERTGKRNIFRHAKREDVESVLANLTSKDPELWAQGMVASRKALRGTRRKAGAGGEAYRSSRGLSSSVRLLCRWPVSDTAHARQNGIIP